MHQDTDTVIEKRKHRHRRQSFRNLLIFLLIVGFCGYLYIQRDAWISKLEGIGSRYESVTQNDGTLAEGNFPLTISSSSGYDAALADDTLFLLHDAYLDVYSLHGDSKDTRQHAFQDAAMTTNGKYVLLYERGGTAFRLDTKNKNIYSKTDDQDIITATVGSDGSIALVTESDSYTCAIKIYDNTGKRIYQRNCVERITDVVFHEDNAGCCFTSVDVTDGTVQNTVTSVLFDQVDTQWTSLPLETLVVKTTIDDDGTLCFIGNTECAYYSSNGEIEGEYSYSGTLVQADCEDGKAALIVEDDQKRKTSLVLLDQSAKDPVTVSVDSTAFQVQVSEGDAVVMTQDSITSYDFSGNPIATVELDGSYTDFLKQDGYLFLLGYHQIDRVDFKE